MGTWRTFDVRGLDAAYERCRETVTTALDSGAILFDSSPMYGEAERVLAGTLAGRRERAIVATKVWTQSPSEGRRQIAQALRWFGGTVDIYQIHNLVGWHDHLPVLEEKRAQGSIRAIGATHYSASAFGELIRVMETGRIQAIQIPYNAADRTVERDVLPLASELGIGVIVMQPLGSGNLVRHPPPPDRLARLKALGISTWAQALLKWVLSDSRAHSVIPATSKVERMRENAAAGDPPWLDDETREYVGSLARAMR